MLVHSVHTAGRTARPVGLRFTGGTMEVWALRLPHGSCKQGLKWIIPPIFRPGPPLTSAPPGGWTRDLRVEAGEDVYTAQGLWCCRALQPGLQTVSLRLGQSWGSLKSACLRRPPQAGHAIGGTATWTHSRVACGTHSRSTPWPHPHADDRLSSGPQRTAGAEGAGPDFLHPCLQSPAQSEEA